MKQESLNEMLRRLADDLKKFVDSVCALTAKPVHVRQRDDVQ